MESMMTTHNKAAIRARMRRAVSELSSDVRRNEEQALCSAIEALPVWREASSVLLYDALPDEIATDLLAHSAQQSPKQIYLPRISGETLSFLPYRNYRGKITALERHPLGMREPSEGQPWSGASGSTVMIVPGRAFTRGGTRLGRGKGFYDRYIGSLPKTVRERVTLIGVGYSVQLVETLPVEPHDVTMDIVAAGEQIIAVGV
jgi:5-formyltetrahydrofolate cyclo-ligase